MSEVNNGDNGDNGDNGIVVVVKQKRGRKSKKELELLAAEKKNSVSNITCLFEDNTLNNEMTNDLNNDNLNNDISNNNLINEIINNTEEKPIAKKRGRKPKGGKIIQQVVSINDNKDVKPNVILHLKCSLNDLQSTIINTNIESFNFSSCKNEISYEIIGDNDLLNTPSPPSNISKNNNTIFNNQLGSNNVFSNNANTIFNNNSLFDNNYSSNSINFNSKIYDDKYSYNDDDSNAGNKEVETKELWKKLKQLEHNLHINNVCSTAHLMEENIDSSTKFERYHLINHIYSKIYNYTKNIKPSPNPYYMLDKYYGNLSIQEYRSLLRNERLFLIVDKPLTRILPELHEDNDDFIINNKIIPSNTYQIKKTVQKKSQSKNNIINEKFGLIQ